MLLPGARVLREAGFELTLDDSLQGWIAHAALDVLEKEPPLKGITLR